MKATPICILSVLILVLLHGSSCSIIGMPSQASSNSTIIDECLANLTSFAVTTLPKSLNATIMDQAIRSTKVVRKINETTYYIRYENANMSALFTGICSTSNSSNTTSVQIVSKMVPKNGTNSTKGINLTVKGQASVKYQQICIMKIVQLLSRLPAMSVPSVETKENALPKTEESVKTVEKRYKIFKFGNSYMLSAGNRAGICNLSNGSATLLPQQFL